MNITLYFIKLIYFSFFYQLYFCIFKNQNYWRLVSLLISLPSSFINSFYLFPRHQRIEVERQEVAQTFLYFFLLSLNQDYKIEVNKLAWLLGLHNSSIISFKYH